MPRPASLAWRERVPLFGCILVAFACGPGTSTGAEGAAVPAPAVASRADVDGWVRGDVRVVAGDVTRTVPRDALGAIARPAAGGAERGYDDARGRAFLAALAAEVDRAPVPGAIDVAARSVRPHVDGRRLDVEAALVALRAGVHAGDAAVEIAVESTPPTAGVFPEGLALDVVLGEYGTEFDTHGRYRTRAHNVRLASSALHGAIVPAGGTLSFNEAVGPREFRRGYKMAPVILQGELVPGVGGGVCQAASTFHAAAFFAGLDVPVYTPHSRPSSYVPAGLDATVAYPDVDLVVRNPFSFPVLVAVETADESVTVRILGRERPRHVELARQVHRGSPFGSRDVEDPQLPLGTRELTQEGAPGSIVLRTRVLFEDDRSWVEHRRLEYPAVDEIFHVGTGPAAIVPAPLAVR